MAEDNNTDKPAVKKTPVKRKPAVKKTTAKSKTGATTTTAKKTSTKKPTVAKKAGTAVKKTPTAKKPTTTKAAEKANVSKQVADSGLASSMLKNQAQEKITNVAKKPNSSKKVEIETIKADEDVTVTLIEEVKAKPKPKVEAKQENKSTIKTKIKSKKNVAPQSTSRVLDSDHTVTVQTSSNLSIKDKDKELAQQMLEDNQILSDRFQLEDIIGIGGMGIVYRAKDIIRAAVKPNNCSVAIKVLSQDVKKHKQALLALQREAYKEQGLSHPNVVKVYDFNRDGDVVYKVMELISGIHLKDWLKEQRNLGKVDYSSQEYINKVVEIINETARGLEYVHSQNIVHSDLKPSNIFVTDNGEIKLFDFGIARTIKQTDFNQKDADLSIFDPTTFAAFTPKYASLEMLTRQDPSEADDVYALGCIMYEMLAGHHPYDGKNAKDALEKDMTANELNYLPKHLEALVLSMVELRREDRISNMSEVLDILNKQTLPTATSNQAEYSNSNNIINGNLMLLNKPFIFTLATLLAIGNIYTINKWFSPTSTTSSVNVGMDLSETVSDDIVSDYSVNTRTVTSAIAGCDQLLSKSVVKDGSACLLSLENDDGDVYRVNMLAFNGDNGAYAIGQTPLNNITVSSLGETLTAKEAEQPLAPHVFTQRSLQTFYITTISLYNGMGLASYKEYLSLVDGNIENLCSSNQSIHKNITLMGSGYGEVTVENGTSFKVVSAVENADGCKVDTMSIAKASNKKLVARLIYKPTNIG